MLTDSSLKSFQPDSTPYKVADEKGMHVLIRTNGKKTFQFRYRYNGKENTLSLGQYPDVSLKKARERRDEARRLLADGIDPSGHKKALKAAKTESSANSFEVIALEWLKKKCQDKSPRPMRQLGFVLPYIGSTPINELLPKHILQCLRKVEERGTVYSAKKALQMYGQIFRYGVATGRCDRDITQDLKGALSTVKGTHFAAITEPDEAAYLLQAIDGYSGSIIVHCALKLAPLVFVRPGELRAAAWQDIDLKKGEWRYFVSKTEVQHIVPLAQQALAILKELRPLTGNGHWLFPSERNPRNTKEGRCMSENTINAALKRLGYGRDVMTAHGFRAMARTILDEVLGYRVDFIEHQLAHAVRDPNGRAYNRTAHLSERKKMMQAWADYLDSIKTNSPIRLEADRKGLNPL